MAIIAPNFSCSDPDLSSTNITEKAWMLVPIAPSHERSIAAIAAIQILFILIGVPWNLIVIITILKKRLYNQPSYVLLLNMIISDLLVCAIIMPFNVVSALSKEFTIGNSDLSRCQACHTIVILIICLVFISLFTLALMSLERLVYLQWPLKYDKLINLKKTVALLAFLWLLCVLLSLPPVFGFGEIKYSNYVSSCSLFVAGRNHVGSNVMYSLVLIVVAIFPFTTIVMADTWLLVIVCKTMRSRYHKKVRSTNSCKTSSSECENADRKMKGKYFKQQIHLAQVFGGIFAANVITWLPSIFISLISARVGAENLPPPLLAFQYLAFFSQPVIHPLLETCLLGKAREVIFSCICCKKSRRKEKRRKMAGTFTSRGSVSTIRKPSSTSLSTTLP